MSRAADHPESPSRPRRRLLADRLIEASRRLHETRAVGGDGQEELRRLRDAFWAVVGAFASCLEAEAFALALDRVGAPESPIGVGLELMAGATRRAFDSLAWVQFEKGPSDEVFLRFFSAELRRPVTHHLEGDDARPTAPAPRAP